MSKDYRELLGWYQDWPDGSSTVKVWFDQNDQKLEYGTRPTDHELMNHLLGKGQILDVRYDVGMMQWVVLSVDRNGKPYRDTSFKLEHALIRVLRNGHPDGDK